jgi:hypothetical protein
MGVGSDEKPLQLEKEIQAVGLARSRPSKTNMRYGLDFVILLPSKQKMFTFNVLLTVHHSISV